jgi:putative intracellular protease/amidase
MTEAKCANCNGTFDMEKATKSIDSGKIICTICGAVNLMPEAEGGEDPLPCLKPKGAEWELPAGKKVVGGTAWYMRADGSAEYTRGDWLKLFMVDPEVQYKSMRSNAAANARDDDVDLSTVGKKPTK